MAVFLSKLDASAFVPDIVTRWWCQFESCIELYNFGEEEIDLELGPGDDGAGAAAPQFNLDTHAALMEQHDMKPNPRKKKKVVKKWRDEWVETYKWAYVAVHEGTPRIFCSVCKEYGRKHRWNPYDNEGSHNMQMSALEEHNNSLLHKEALRLQMASKDKGLGLIDLRPVFIKGRQVVQYPISSEHGITVSEGHGYH